MLSAEQGRALVAARLPNGVADRGGWAADVHAAFATLDIATTPSNVCAALAVIEQESGYTVDPVVPGLGRIARREIDRRAEQAGVPQIVVAAALRLESPDGRSYGERIDAARTERQLSETFEDFIGMVPLGRSVFGDRNPVRTGGPMQVSIAFAEAHAQDRTYPYALEDGVRREVFTRRGGLYFGIAHLLGYPADYDRLIYRYADFNAGRWASRNAAFQNALAVVSGLPLALDGDLLREGAAADHGPGETERAALALAARLDLGPAAVRRDLERGRDADFSRTRLYREVHALAERLQGRPLPRALVPRIALKSPKITRKLTTAWFAERVDARHRQCMARAAGR